MGIEHGEVSISLKGNIIVVRNVGAFNEYGAQKYTNGVEAIVDDLKDTSFSILVNNLEFQGATPEAYQELEKYNVWLNQQKLIAKAMVITSNTILDVINKLSPSRASQQTRSFDNEEDAMSWLQALS
ncbi:MAG: hypothetical protein HRT50_01605 [Colwellia sp.]|uniref:STAS/SEC14 domain-containing protein n=1 Tax=Colwellia sp. TaxID=56799 RepID=UPI001D79531D|nr:hypothetical protein [Colwellia sp.]NQY47796.1 hypothetical protein [Colwellia sp.]